MTAEEVEPGGASHPSETDSPEQTRATRRGPVLLLAVALVLAVAAGFALGSQGDSPQAPSFDQGDPFVLLETALGSNTPAFVLIHSAT